MPGFKPATRSAGKSGKASGKPPAKSGKPTNATSAKPGGCGTGAGGFQAGNTCGHKGNRNQKVETARAAHTAAKADVLKHVKAHRNATKAAVKAGEAAPAPKDLHAAIKRAAAAHGELKAARDVHRENKRAERNASARERRAVKAGRAEPLTARPKPAGPTLREQADKHRAAQNQAMKDRDSPNSFRDPSEFRDRKLNATKAVREQLIHAASRGRQALKSKINELKRRANPGSAADRGVRYGTKLLESNRLKPKTKSGPDKPTTTPPHTGLTSSQARPSATTPPTRNDRLAVLAARHDIAGKRLATLRDESARHAYTGQVLSGKGNVNPESPTQRGRYAESHAIGRRAQIHKETAERLRESIHDPAKSGAAARTLKSLSNNPVGSRANELAIRGVAGKLTHSELKAAATGAGLDHGGSRNRYELRDHLLRTVGKAPEPATKPSEVSGKRAPMSKKPKASYLDQIVANQKSREASPAKASARDSHANHVEREQHAAMEDYKAAHEKLFTAPTEAEKTIARLHVARAKAKLDALHARTLSR